MIAMGLEPWPYQSQNCALNDLFLVSSPACLQRSSCCRHVPTFRQELLDGALLNTFLHAEFVVQKMVGKCSSITIDAVNANAIAVAIGTD